MQVIQSFVSFVWKCKFNPNGDVINYIVVSYETSFLLLYPSPILHALLFSLLVHEKLICLRLLLLLVVACQTASHSVIPPVFVLQRIYWVYVYA